MYHEKVQFFIYFPKYANANVVRISISISIIVDDLFDKYKPNTSSKF